VAPGIFFYLFAYLMMKCYLLCLSRLPDLAKKASIGLLLAAFGALVTFLAIP